MAVFAIGDIQGCYAEFRALLERIEFDPRRDQVWLAGDLVNRGPDSLAVLRYVHQLGDAAICVLGNHDLHMLAVAKGGQPVQRKDNFDAVLDASDGPELLDWLRRQPLLHHDPQLGYALTHAGIYPDWTLAEAQDLAAEAEAVIGGPENARFFRKMYGNKPARWSAELNGIERIRFIVNCFTRMRYLDAEHRLDFKHKGPPGSQPRQLVPWYDVPERRNRDTTVLFGHWSTHGAAVVDNAIPLDTGCLWGGQLTALRLDGPRRFYRLECPGAREPKAG